MTLCPISLYNLNVPEDFSGESAGSPCSPSSPVFTNPYQLPIDNDWINWVDDKQVDDELFKTEPFDIDLSSIPSRTLTQSPIVDPAQLSNAMAPEGGGVGAGGGDFPFIQQKSLDDTPDSLFKENQQRLQQGQQRPQHLQLSRQPPPPPPSQRRQQQQSTITSSPRSSRKRKSSSSDDQESRSTLSPSPPPPPAAHRRRTTTSSGSGSPPPKKTAHNMIEKRYRTNLNDKIAALRDSVPALRVMAHKIDSYATPSLQQQQLQQQQHQGEQPMQMQMQMQIQRRGSEEAEGGPAKPSGPAEKDSTAPAPAHKLNKGTILSKATEYIAHLERQNAKLERENAQLRASVEGARHAGGWS